MNTNFDFNSFNTTTESSDCELPRFIRVLFSILNDTQFVQVIRWAHSGTAMEIVDFDAMSTYVLPRFFNHQKFKSFQRQLNYFGFRKWTKTQSDTCTFSNPNFQQFSPEKAALIKKSKKVSVGVNRALDFDETEDIPVFKKAKVLDNSKFSCEPLMLSESTLFDTMNFFDMGLLDGIMMFTPILNTHAVIDEPTTLQSCDDALSLETLPEKSFESGFVELDSLAFDWSTFDMIAPSC